VSVKPKVSSHANGAEIFFDERARSLRLGEADPVVLRAKSFATFLALARHSPNLLSKDDLIEEVWGQSAVSDDSITQCIADIRRALGDRGHALLQTTPGIGYTLTALTCAEGEGAAPPVGRRSKPIWIISGVVGVMGLLAVSAVVFTLRPQTIVDPIAVTNQTTKPAVAALTFDTIGDDRNLTSFAEALRNDIVVALSALDTVSVLAPSILSTSSALNETPLRAYAAKGAGYVVGGTIQSAGSGLRVSAHLIDTTTSQIVWVRRWESDQGDLLSLQDEIVKALAAELANPWSGRLTGLGSGVSSEDPGADLTAEAHVRLGAGLFREYHAQAFTEAEQHFRKALDLDAQNAEAWAGLSFVLGAMLPLAKSADIQSLREARANSGRQAYHIGAGSGRSLLAGSWTAALRGNKTETMRRLTEAVAKLQGDADALAIASLQGALTTQAYAEAADWGEQALGLTAQAPPWYFLGPGVAYFFQSDLQRAKSNLKQAPQNLPTTMVFLAAAHAVSGDLDQAVATLAQLRMLQNDFTLERYLAAELLIPSAKMEEVRAVFTTNGLADH